MKFLTFEHGSAEIDRTMTFAHRAHEGQRRKYDGTPYISHPVSVARLCFHMGLPEIAVQAALLHDTVEDCDTEQEDITREFGEDVSTLVFFLTDPEKEEYPLVDGKAPNRAARKAFDRARIARAPFLAQSVKCADIFDNTSSIVDNDPNFARVYLHEVLKTLHEMTDVHAGLLQMAHDTVVAGMRRLNAEDALRAELKESLRYSEALNK